MSSYMKSNTNPKFENQEQDESKRLQGVEERKKINESSIDIPISLDSDKLYNLPNKSKVSTNTLYHSKRQDLGKNEYTKEITELVQQIDKVLETHLYTWDHVEKWTFNLPHTMFSGNEAPIQFFQPQAKIGTHEMRKLTADHCEQIRKKGEFKVQGVNEDEMTTWKLNSWIIRGEEFITNQFQKALGVAWHQLLQIKCRVAPKYARNYKFAEQFLNPNIVDGFKTIFSIFSKILNLTFGVKKERMQATIKQNHQQLRLSYFEFVFKSIHFRNKSEYTMTEKEKKDFENIVSDFRQLTTDFDNWARKYQIEKIKELEKSDKNEDEALLEIFHEKQKHLFSLIQNGKYIKEKDVQQHLINLIQATQITNRYYYELSSAISEKRTQTTAEVKEKHPIKSRVNLWRERVVKELMQPIIAKMIVDCNQKILKELNEKNLKSESILFVRFTEFQQAIKQIYNDNFKRIQSQSTLPCRVFKTFQQYMPPFKIKQRKDYDGNPVYEYETGKDYTTNTDFFGWRIVLQLIRYKVWTINVFINLVQNLINGSFGLKALFKAEPFSRGMYVDYRTGVEKSSGNHYPYIIVLKKTLQGIKDSLNAFEAMPDRGIFGKNFARIFKYIECYIFRFLFVAIFIVGLGMPLAIITNCLMSFFLAVTSWLWIPVTLTFRYLYHLFIWDFDSPTRKGWYNYPNYSLRYQTFERFPIVTGSFNLILGVFEIIGSILSMIIIHPLLALLSTILAFSRQFITTILDSIMCWVTRKIGRQPEIDTFIAWKVRGTGVARQYTYSIDVEDVKFLMRGHLESVELQEYQYRLENKINEPNVMYENVSKQLFRYYDIQQGSNSYISQNINKLKGNLDVQLRERRKKYPQLPRCNIKFTEEELSNIFFSCESMTKQFIETRSMNWVFTKLGIENNDLKALTEKLLIDLFNDENILYPISEIDKRIEIKTVKKSHFDSVSKAIEGQTHLKTYAATIKQKFKKFKKEYLFPFISNNEIQYHTENSFGNQSIYYKNNDPSAITYFFSPKLYEKVLAEKDAATKKTE